jgi:MFS family permease
VRLRSEPGATFRSLRNYNFRLYVSGMTASTIGTWLQIVAQDWLVLNITGNSGSALGVTTALQFVPLLAFGLWGGVLADRFSKRLILMATEATMGVLAVVLGILTVSGSVRIWHVYALAFTLGIAMVVDFPTQQSFIVELVPAAQRTNAIALDGAGRASARLVGPAAAGLLINTIGIGPVFLLNGLSYCGMLLALKLIRERELYVSPRAAKMKGQLSAGLSYVRGRSDLGLVLVLVGFVAAFGLNLQITTALMTKNVFHDGAGSYGLASTGFAVGSLAGSLLAARIIRPTKRLLLTAALLVGVLEGLSALAPTYGWFLPLLPPTGLMLVIFTNGAVVTLQLNATPEMRGRISGLYYLVFNGTTPISAPLIGWLAQMFGARVSLVTDSVMIIVATMAIAPLLTRRKLAFIPQPVRTPEHSS